MAFLKHIQLLLTLLITTAFALGACNGGPALAAATDPVAFTQTPTLLPPTGTPFPASTLTQVLTPTITLTPTVTATFQPLRHTPPTLMLHRSNLSFDALQFLKDFIVILQQKNMHVVTYRKITDHPELTATEQGRLFIITIDDIYLRYPIDPNVLQMIDCLRQAGYPAVLGVITESDYAYPETVNTLKELSDAGWEIASHTDNHSNLGVMERTAPRYVYIEVETSVDKIANAIGVRPITLVLPDGQMVNDPNMILRAGIFWIVGINGGTTYVSTKKIVYVGREGPDGSAAETFRIMMERFNP